MRNRTLIVVVGLVALAAVLVAGQLYLTRPKPSPAASPTATNASTELTSQTGVPGVVPPLPGGKALPSVAPSGPAKEGALLHPLSSAPVGVVAGLVNGKIPPGSVYTVKFRPWGYGPAGSTGQTVVITVTSFAPTGSAPEINAMSRTPLLAVMDARQGGDVRTGGAQTGTLTFLKSGTSVVPVLSKVTGATP